MNQGFLQSFSKGAVEGKKKRKVDKMLSKGNIYKGNSVREKIPLEKHRKREFKNTERKKKLK